LPPFFVLSRSPLSYFSEAHTTAELTIPVANLPQFTECTPFFNLAHSAAVTLPSSCSGFITPVSTLFYFSPSLSVVIGSREGPVLVTSFVGMPPTVLARRNVAVLRAGRLFVPPELRDAFFFILPPPLFFPQQALTYFLAGPSTGSSFLFPDAGPFLLVLVLHLFFAAFPFRPGLRAFCD